MKFDLLTIDDLGKLGRGRSRNRPRDDKSLYGGIYPFIQTGDVKNAPFYITSYSQTYNEKGLAQSKLWKRGTLCITIAANIADTAILAIDACFPDSILGFIPYKDKSDVKFVKYCFDVYKTTLEAISKGTTQDNLSLDKLRKIKFRIPLHPNQCKIAAVLSAYDDLIENNNRRIAILEKMAEELYREWFVRLRFPGHEKTKIIKGVPEGWEIVSAGKYKNFTLWSLPQPSL
jgi:type I restriction enzyme S subunit